MHALIMSSIPLFKTNIAKLMSAKTLDVIAATDLVNKYMAGWALLAIFETVEKVDVTGTFVFGELTHSAKFNSTLLTFEEWFCGVNDPLTFLSGAQTEVGITDCLPPEKVSLMFLLHVV